MTTGAYEKKPTSAKAVADPVSWKAHIVNANWVMPLPNMEMTWPNQIKIKAFMPDGWCVAM